MPSTTIIAQPAVMMPAYNPIKYIIDNTNKNEPGFRYLFTIYPAASAEVIAQYKTLPVFGTGYGEQDVSKLMQSLVTWKFAAGQVNESWYQYDIKFGFEYTANIQYTNSLTQSTGGDIVIHYNAHGFVLGDQISITQAAGGIAANPTVEGLHTVIFASANLFVINARWDTVTNATINGTVTYADLRKYQLLDDVALSSQEVFNGAYNNWTNTANQSNAFPSAYFLANGANDLLMTSNFAGQYHPVSAFLNAQFYYNLKVYAGDTYFIRFYNMSNTQIDSSLFIPANDGIYAVFVGPTALITEDYYVIINNNTGFTADAYYFTYDNRCTINDQQLIYLDRMGSWQSFAFQLRTYEKGQITREQYNQHIDGQVSSSQWVGVNLQKGFRTYNTNVTKTFDLNTNWMDQYDATRFQELLTSPQVYYNYNSGEIFAACVVESSSFEVFSQKNKKLIKQSVTIRLAQQDPING